VNLSSMSDSLTSSAQPSALVSTFSEHGERFARGAIRAIGQRDYFVDGKTLAIASLRMSPYVSSGQFLSRVIGGGNSRSWNNVTWTGNTPAGTSIVVSVRLGDTPAPDGTWTAFTPVTSGAAIPGSSKYLQYRVSLATTDPAQTPVFSDITFR